MKCSIIFVKRLVTYTLTTSLKDMAVKINVKLSAFKFPIPSGIL